MGKTRISERSGLGVESPSKWTLIPARAWKTSLLVCVSGPPCFSVTVINAMIHSNLGGTGFIRLTLTSHHPWHQDRNSRKKPEAGTEAETKEEGCLLSGLLLRACSTYFLMRLRATCPRMALPTQLPDPSKTILDGENVPKVLPTGQSDGSNSSTEVLSSQMNLVCDRRTRISTVRNKGRICHLSG